MNLTSDTLAGSALAFRGYNVTNLGRTPELLEHRLFGPIVEHFLREASSVCSDVTGRPADLVAMVRAKREATLAEFAEAVALILAVEIAHLTVLDEFFDLRPSGAKMMYGYSLGEIGALVAGGVFEFADALRIPLALADDCAQLAADATLGVVFSRGAAIDLDIVHWICVKITGEGHGVIGVSAYLSPNTCLIIGQRRTVDRFAELQRDLLPKHVHLRKNESHFPPLHTPILAERCVADRAAVLMRTLKGGMKKPTPEIISLATGKASYTDSNCRDVLRDWIDHPQRLWDAIYETLAQGVETVIHIGAEPNLLPATFQRLADNVQGQVAQRGWSGLGLRAVSQVMRRPWLAKLLPTRSALLRAPYVDHIILEDWLLAQPVK